MTIGTMLASSKRAGGKRKTKKSDQTYRNQGTSERVTDDKEHKETMSPALNL